MTTILFLQVVFFFCKRKFNGRVHIFWEGHKCLRNLHLRFVLCSNSQIYGGDFWKFCGLHRIYELWWITIFLYSFWTIYLKICLCAAHTECMEKYLTFMVKWTPTTGEDSTPCVYMHCAPPCMLGWAIKGSLGFQAKIFVDKA